eukprot:6206941-Pleurochrysis_carterae.AAC.1
MMKQIKRRRAGLQAYEQHLASQPPPQATPRTPRKRPRTKAPNATSASSPPAPLATTVPPTPPTLPTTPMTLTASVGAVTDEVDCAAEWEPGPAAVPSMHVQLQGGNPSLNANDAEPITVLLGKLSLEHYAERFIAQGCVAAFKALMSSKACYVPFSSKYVISLWLLIRADHTSL